MAEHRDTRPGFGVALASLLGFLGLALGVLAWILGAGVGWALLIWLMSGPATLLCALLQLRRADPHRRPVPPQRGFTRKWG